MRIDALADAWRAAFREGGFEAICTEDVSYEDPVAVEPLRGPAALDDLAATMRTVLPDLVLEPAGDPLAGGSYACIPWRAKGTHRGELGSMPPTNRFVVVHGLHYVELHDGLVRRARGFFDLYDIATQVGLLPRRGSLGETALMLVRGFGLRVTRER